MKSSTIIKTAQDFVAIAGNYQTQKAFQQTKNYQTMLLDQKSKHQYCQGCHLAVDDITCQLVEVKTLKNSQYLLLCDYCAKLKLFDQYRLSYDGNDQLIYLPNMSQSELHHLYYACKKNLDDPEVDSFQAKELITELSSLAKYLDDVAGVNISHPGVFVHYYHQVEKSNKFLKDIRWFDGSLLQNKFE
ncbi:hypothetical protein [Facilibium subflavum]|uniref:hypothetical protein n=1 Tax=Facilibium subflavum TaxID=2219058 RepID=UPI000E65D81A|nr:hypothetical protein [Facilibium subflavum]